MQARLDSAKTSAERNKMGQFATPPALAMEVVRYARSIFPRSAKARFMDPAFGTGSFYSALLATFPAGRIATAIGFEIDPHYGKGAAQLWGETALDLRIADFTKAVPPDSEARKPNLIVCNPPYVRHHHLSADEKPRLRRLAQRAAGVDMNGLSGLYCYFLAAAHAWMAKDALAVWLVPSEFMDVNYGRPLKEYLLGRVKLLRIHRFDPTDVQFDDALVSSAVVCFANAQSQANHCAEFTYGGTLAAPKASAAVVVDTLRSTKKWTCLASTGNRERPGNGARISDLFTIRRGIAAGSNEFFILTKEAASGLPREFLRPILPSPRYLKTDTIEADESGNPVMDEPLFLLDCSLPETQVRQRFPRLWECLEKGRRAGIHTGYLCRHREPWYSQEARPPAPLLCTYMGRKDKAGGAFRFILNKSRAIAANVYLMLYPKPALARQIKKSHDLLAEIWRALNSIPPESLIGAGRVYGGGLYKMEPKELADAPADAMVAVLPENLASEQTLFALNPTR
ncbi:MAG: Eco57I restriction-modification methylase domain-containing protein [Phycisphaerae bacterium]